MNETPLLLTIAYLVIAFLLLVLCLATRWPRSVKIGMVVMVTASYFVSQAAFREMLGWPAVEAPPEKFVLLSTVVQEPDKERGIKGSIFIWVNGLQGTKLEAEPRAFQLPYGKELHSTLNEAMKKNRQGTSQIGSTEPPVGGKGGSWLRNAADPNVKIKISDAPAPQLPEK